MATHDHSATVTHPVQAGRTASTLYSLAESTRILQRGILVLVLAQGLLWWDLGRGDEPLGWLLLAAMVGLVALTLVNRQARRAAWAEVPGGWGWRFAARGDHTAGRTDGWPETVWLIARGWSWVVGGIFLATLDVSATARFVVIGGLGAYYLGAVGGMRLSQLLAGGKLWASRALALSAFEGASWVAIGVLIATAGMSGPLLPLLAALVLVAGTSVGIGVLLSRIPQRY